MMSTPVYVDPESSTQADGAQSSRVPVPLPEDPYKAIRQAYLDGTDTKSEPFEDPTDTETPESPLAIAPPILPSKSTPPVLVPILRRTACMAVRVPHAMSSGLSASMAEVAAMSESALCKRFRSSCESSPSVSPPDLPFRKRYRGTSKLVEDSEEDDDEEDEEIEESMDSDSMSEDAKDKGPTAEDRILLRRTRVLLDDESHGIDDEGHNVESDGLGLEEEGETYPGVSNRQLRLWGRPTFEVGQGSGSAPVSERPERVSAFRQPILTTWTDPEDGMIYIDIPDYPPPAPPVQTPPLPEYTSGSLPVSPSHSDVPSPVSLPIIPLTVPSPVATPAAVETEGFLTELGAQERVAVKFGAIWRPVLALEAWAGQTDAQRAALWHAILDVQGENRDLRLHLAEERRARLELAEVVDGRRRGQEPRGGA
ncbi:hypothetical protein Tco_1256641 [Tanacetum coccineum]